VDLHTPKGLTNNYISSQGNWTAAHDITRFSLSTTSGRHRSFL